MWLLVIAFRKPRSDALDKKTKDLIREFWDKNSRPSPCHRDVIGKRGKDRTPQPKRFLEVSQTEVFIRFKQQYPDIKVRQRAFEKLKPWYIRPTLRSDRVVCACQTHVNMKEMFLGWRQFRSKKVKAAAAAQGRLSWQYSKTLPDNLTDLANEVLCEIDINTSTNPEFHNLKCVDGECGNCGMHRLVLVIERSGRKHAY